MTFDEIKNILSLTEQSDIEKVCSEALAVKDSTVGREVYLRGLIEMSNICRKDCLYCGIRRSNDHVDRYTLTHDEVIAAAQFTHQMGFGSIVIQSGELLGDAFVDTLTDYIEEIHHLFPDLLITLSCGEQPATTYRRWYDAGASRYLLRIESSDINLYHKIHPNDENHSFEARIQALRDLRNEGFQVGTGVMIGLPDQTVDMLARDLLFFRDLDVDMIGMGPFIEHSETPLYSRRAQLWTLKQRFEKSLLMIAALRMLMPTINIAASTALESLDPQGRQKGLLAGANVVMPNVTPLQKKVNYKLYEDKPGVHLDPSQTLDKIRESIESCGHTIAFNNPGIPQHFILRTQH